jgi:hypothetical protein
MALHRVQLIDHTLQRLRVAHEGQQVRLVARAQARPRQMFGHLHRLHPAHQSRKSAQVIRVRRFGAGQ